MFAAKHTRIYITRASVKALGPQCRQSCHAKTETITLFK